MKGRTLGPGARNAAMLVVCLAGGAFGQETNLKVPPSTEVRDLAGLFGLDAVREARAALGRIGRRTGQPILIETVGSLDGEGIDDASLRRARQSLSGGIYVLIARDERAIQIRDLDVFAGPGPREAIRDAFTGAFSTGDLDDGLARGVEAIGLALADPRPRTGDDLPDPPGPPAGALAHRARDPADPGGDGEAMPPLVLRNQVRLTLGGARAIVEAAEAKASAMGLKVNIAVVDDGGHLLTFARMDGARPASGYTALTKATTAATFRQATGPLPTGTTDPDPLLNLSLQNAASASGGKVTTLFGGVPVVVDGQVIGGVGVGGGTGEQDAEVARAGIDALLGGLEGRD